MTMRYAFRSLLKHPVLNMIKVTGIGLAMGSLMMIILFLNFEMGFDRTPPHSERIYRLTTTSPDFFNGKHFARMINASYIPELAEHFPGIEDYVRLVPMRGGVIRYDELHHSMGQGFLVDSTFFQIFGSSMLIGDPETVLNTPGSMVISESMAERVFGDLNPVGETLTLPSGQFYGEDTDFTVSGVMRDHPSQSHFHPDLIASPHDRSVFGFWAWTYLRIKEHATPEDVLEGFEGFYTAHFDQSSEDFSWQAHLQELHRIHLHSHKTREIEQNGNMAVVWSFSVAAILMLVIALLNYANLGIGMSVFSERFLFIGKVCGSARLRLRYFLSEGILLAGSGAVLGLILTWLANQYVHKRYTLDLLGNDRGLAVLVFVVFSSFFILAGLLPMVSRSRAGRSLVRKSSKGLLVIQFGISIALIISVLVIHRQTVFVLDKSLGNEDPDLICLPGVHQEVQRKFTEFKNQLLSYPSIASVSAMMEPPGGDANDMFPFTMEGYISDDNTEESDMINVYPCDYSFATLFDLEFLAGENFSERFEDHEGSGEYLINESAMRRFNYSDPHEVIGREFDLNWNDTIIPIPSGRIIGVVKDFHLSSLKNELEPLVMFKRKDLWIMNFLLAPEEGMREQAMLDLSRVWEQLFPQYPLQYEYVNSMYRSVYSQELLQARLLGIFTFIALFISSMGLLGVSLLATRQRIKEIGIRKVNGASSKQIMLLLVMDMLRWILLSFLISVPLAFIVMNRWMEAFAYRSPLSWWMFLLAGALAVLAALMTISLQTWRASSRNPVEALRYE